jgi:hypothetical protein
MPERADSSLSFGTTTVATLITTARARIASPGDRTWEEIGTAVAMGAKRVADQNSTRAIDPPTGQWLLNSSLALAAYLELKSFAGSAEALAIVGEAMTAPFKKDVPNYLSNRFGISQDAPEQAFDRVAENFKKQGEERFGMAFVYVQDAQDENRSFTNIHRCFFNDFFRDNGAPEVTSVFCALDSVWASELDEKRYRIRFDRPTTLAKGDDACRFQFRRI